MLSGRPHEDDPSIAPERKVWRRIPLSQAPVDEGDPAHRRLSEAAFSDSSDGSGMSVHLVEATDTVDSFLHHAARELDGIAELSVGDIRRVGCGVCRDPIESDSGHCVIVGVPLTGKKRKVLFKLASMVREPVAK